MDRLLFTLVLVDFTKVFISLMSMILQLSVPQSSRHFVQIFLSIWKIAKLRIISARCQSDQICTSNIFSMNELNQKLN